MTMTNDNDNLEDLAGPELRARAMRDRLKERVLNLVDRYCDEAEHQEGYMYWDTPEHWSSHRFATTDKAVKDFVLWATYELDDDEV